MDNYIKMVREIFIYTVLAIAIGILVGILDAFFGRELIYITQVRESYPFQLIILLPFAGVLIIYLYKKFSTEAMKGMTLIFETGFGDIDTIPIRLIPLVIVNTWITHLFGGSAGREGVAVQIGAATANSFGRVLKIKDHTRMLIIIGMSAGFGGLYRTPIAATFFALEVLVAGAMQYEALLPAMTGAFTASYVSGLLGLEKFSVNLNMVANINYLFVLKVILCGIAFGIVGSIFAYLLDKMKSYLVKYIPSGYKRIFFTGIFLSVAFLLLFKGRYSGLGTNLINSCFGEGEIFYYDWALKLILTVITLSCGYQGGEVTPIFAIGASLGLVLGQILNIDPIFTAALGYTAVFAAATNTLVGPIFIGAEVFGAEYVIYFAVVCTIARVFNNSRTIYHKQRAYKF